MELLEIDKGLSILVIEDSLADFQTIQRLFQKSGVTNPVHHCETGKEAQEYLQTLNGHTGKPDSKPGIILLDLNLPETDGREILKLIKMDNELKSIPVIVFTTSDSEDDIVECYQHGANSYITKPVDLNKFREVVELIKSYWLHTVALPAA